jgi:hypothetical protein
MEAAAISRNCGLHRLWKSADTLNMEAMFLLTVSKQQKHYTTQHSTTEDLTMM